jgi:uncharacterized membrane protein YedE/YeeE
MAAGGLLVGIGTKLGGGCTSGHGVCGLARLSGRSMVATVTFLAVAVVNSCSSPATCSRGRLCRFSPHFVSGLLFGAGLALSGMVNPAKVLNFLDLAGSIRSRRCVFVLGGAVVTTFIGYRFMLPRSEPKFAERFQLADEDRRGRPTRRRGGDLRASAGGCRDSAPGRPSPQSCRCGSSRSSSSPPWPSA